MKWQLFGLSLIKHVSFLQKTTKLLTQTDFPLCTLILQLTDISIAEDHCDN